MLSFAPDTFAFSKMDEVENIGRISMPFIINEEKMVTKNRKIE